MSARAHTHTHTLVHRLHGGRQTDLRDHTGKAFDFKGLLMQNGIRSGLANEGSPDSPLFQKVLRFNGTLNEKCSPQAHLLEHLVPRW